MPELRLAKTRMIANMIAFAGKVPAASTERMQITPPRMRKPGTHTAKDGSSQDAPDYQGKGKIHGDGEGDEEITVKLFLKKAKPPYVRGWNYLVFGKMGDRYAGQLKELAEIVRGERPNPQELYDHDLLVHKLSLQACNISLVDGKNPVAVDAFESGGHRIVASGKELDVR